MNRDDDAWRAEVDEERRLGPWKSAAMNLSLARNRQAAEKALCELVNLYRRDGQFPPFAQVVLAELIAPQGKAGNCKLSLKWTGGLERRVKQTDERHNLAQAIEAEQKRTGCSQKDAVEKIARSSPRTAERAIRGVRRDRKMVEEILGPSASSEAKGPDKK